jgi:hypothetical protein
MPTKSEKMGKDKKSKIRKDEPITEESLDTKEDVNSLQEFIELKKLQNRILRKMLEKNIQPIDKNNSKTK